MPLHILIASSHSSGQMQQQPARLTAPPRLAAHTAQRASVSLSALAMCGVLGSFLDHLQFCFEYGSIHYKQHSPRVLYLHSIMGVGTNLFPMPMSKVFKPFQSILGLGYHRLWGRVVRCVQLRASAAIWIVERSASCVLWSPSSR